MNKSSLVFLGLLAIFNIGCQTYQLDRQSSKSGYLTETQLVQTEQTEFGSEENSNTKNTDNPLVSEQKLPDSIVAQVPFSSQAPFANWDNDHNEACEEASLLLANEFVRGNKSSDLDRFYADSEIIKMISWERENWGGHFDLEIEKTKELAEKFYNTTNLEIKTINSIEEIKSYLATGKIIVAPTAGRKLGNPNFKTPGPVYHMLVIKGYDSDNFITNDVGTKNGKDYKYKYEVLFLAIHDLPQEARFKEHFIKNHPELIGRGEKKVLIINGTR